MKKTLAFNGSPRKTGNTSAMLEAFRNGWSMGDGRWGMFSTSEINIKNCTGCLRCNILKRCSLRDDDWAQISEEILDADVLVFATPIYFHHVTASMKLLIDRFRSFVHVQITETGIEHTPHTAWNKDFVLLLPMGSSDPVDAQPVIDLFNYMCSILGPQNRLHVIKGTRLAVVNQVKKSQEELELLYPKLGIPVRLAQQDARCNAELLERCFDLGQQLSH